ncbi:hypothetical protein, partial [Winogradskyella luteola]
MTANSMITSIRNNLNLLSKRNRLKNKLGGFNSEKKVEYNFPKATKKQLNDIAKQLKEEHRIRMLKVVIVTFILFLGLVVGFLYSTDG